MKFNECKLTDEYRQFEEGRAAHREAIEAEPDNEDDNDCDGVTPDKKKKKRKSFSGYGAALLHRAVALG